MKRVKNLFPKLLSDENILEAIHTVNRSHRSHKGRPNELVEWVERTIDERVHELRYIVLNGFEPSPIKRRNRYDHSAGKWREICEPKLYPDQYIHHMVVQVLQPVMMRGMDYWCCGSIKGRGIKRGIHGIKRWFKDDKKNTKYAAELDIYHFYDSLKPEIVMKRMRKLVKDNRMLDTIWRLVKDGIMIGAYFSQWFANTVLQPLDHLIRERIHIKHYVRYMDNITIFGRNKKLLHKAVRIIKDWLKTVGLQLKSNWQVFRTKYRMVSAMGYRFDSKKTLLRKRNLLRLKRQLAFFYRQILKNKLVSFRVAAGILSRIGQLKHCDSMNIRERYIFPGTIKILKNIVRDEMKYRSKHRKVKKRRASVW